MTGIPVIMLFSSLINANDGEVQSVRNESAVLRVDEVADSVGANDYCGNTDIKVDSLPNYGVATAGRSCAVKTNALVWAAAVVNLEGDIQVARGFSVSLSVWWSPYFVGKSHGLRTLAILPEGRYWLRQVGSGHFVGVHASVAWFNLRNGDYRYQDVGRPLLGGGLTYGYSLEIGKQWGLEFIVGAGYASMKYDRFYNIENGARIDTRKTSYWGIDRLGVSISYRFSL